MKIINPSFEVIYCPEYSEALRIVETAARTCYKSEEKITEESAEPFIRGVIKRGHLSVLEHLQCTFRIITDRGVSHEWVRHRIGVAVSQESTRFCKYNNEIAVIPPSDLGDKDSNNWDRWKIVCETAEKRYIRMLEEGVSPQMARSVLPTCLKTEFVWSANLRALRHFFNLRAIGTTGPPHPDIKLLAAAMLEEMKRRLPVFFEDLNNKE